MGKQSTGANRGDIFIKDHKKSLRQKKILIYFIEYYDFEQTMLFIKSCLGL